MKKRYHIKKEEKHDYASFGKKIYRKMHACFYRMIKDRKKAYPLYASYRHRNKNGKTEGEAKEVLYMTEQPAYLAGFGHGLGAWRAGLMNAERFGLNYAYTPMVNDTWDRTLGLGDGLPSAKELLRQGFKKVLLPYYNMDDPSDRALIQKIIESYEGSKTIFYNEYEQWTGRGDDIEGDKRLREIFWNSATRKKDQLIYSSEEVNIALHIRRGDVKSRLQQGDDSMKSRWVELSFYESIIHQLIDLSSRPDKLAFYVFSEGQEKDFDELLSIHPKVHLCLDMSAEASFLHLCYADLLTTAASSFSIIAGAINRGIKIVPDREWLTIPETKEWIRVDSESGKLPDTEKQRISELINNS